MNFVRCNLFTLTIQKKNISCSRDVKLKVSKVKVGSLNKITR